MSAVCHGAPLEHLTYSALDTSTEKDIQKALLNLMKGRSSLSIAHRLSVSGVFGLVNRDGSETNVLMTEQTIASADLYV